MLRGEDDVATRTRYYILHAFLSTPIDSSVIISSVAAKLSLYYVRSYAATDFSKGIQRVDDC